MSAFTAAPDSGFGNNLLGQRDVLDEVLAHMDAQELANFGKTARVGREAAARNRLVHIVTELAALAEGRSDPGNTGTFLGSFIYNESRPAVIFEGHDRIMGINRPLPRVTRSQGCTLGAAFGKLEWLKFLRLKGFGCGDTLRAAAGAGHLEVLKWAWMEGCPWTTTSPY